MISFRRLKKTNKCLTSTSNHCFAVYFTKFPLSKAVIKWVKYINIYIYSVCVCVTPRSDFLTLSSSFLIHRVCLEVLKKIFLINSAKHCRGMVCFHWSWTARAHLQASGEPYEAFSKVTSRINKAWKASLAQPRPTASLLCSRREEKPLAFCKYFNTSSSLRD